MGRWVLVAVASAVEEALAQGLAQVQVWAQAPEDVAEGVEVMSAWELPAAVVQG